MVEPSSWVDLDQELAVRRPVGLSTVGPGPGHKLPTARAHRWLGAALDVGQVVSPGERWSTGSGQQGRRSGRRCTGTRCPGGRTTGLVRADSVMEWCLLVSGRRRVPA